MLIDQASLFVAAGVCAGALSLTMLSAWLHNRSDSFLLGWMLGMGLLGAGVITYVTLPPDRMGIVATAFGLETIGFVVVLISARQFTGRPTSWLQAGVMMTCVPLVVLPILAGYDGLGIMIFNYLAAVLLVATGMQYLSARAEAPSSVAALTVLYSLAALSFAACGTVLLHETRWVLHQHPDNWAEHLNAIMCIAGITGAGALSIGLNHARAARKHMHEARTDALTGLLNRRALFETMTDAPLSSGHAVIAFDLDSFKAVNDRCGHAAGDGLLKCFADALRQNLRDGDLAARIGGEEFVLVLRQASLQVAAATAERVRAIFAESYFESAKGRVSGTASAGVATAGAEGETFESLLARADAKLYRAKDDGRNRIVTHLHAVA